MFKLARKLNNSQFLKSKYSVCSCLSEYQKIARTLVEPFVDKLEYFIRDDSPNFNYFVLEKYSSIKEEFPNISNLNAVALRKILMHDFDPNNHCVLEKLIKSLSEKDSKIFKEIQDAISGPNDVGVSLEEIIGMLQTQKNALEKNLTFASNPYQFSDINVEKKFGTIINPEISAKIDIVGFDSTKESLNKLLKLIKSNSYDNLYIELGPLIFTEDFDPKSKVKKNPTKTQIDNFAEYSIIDTLKGKEIVANLLLPRILQENISIQPNGKFYEWLQANWSYDLLTNSVMNYVLIDHKPKTITFIDLPKWEQTQDLVMNKTLEEIVEMKELFNLISVIDTFDYCTQWECRRELEGHEAIDWNGYKCLNKKARTIHSPFNVFSGDEYLPIKRKHMYTSSYIQEALQDEENHDKKSLVILATDSFFPVLTHILHTNEGYEPINSIYETHCKLLKTKIATTNLLQKSAIVESLFKDSSLATFKEFLKNYQGNTKELMKFYASLVSKEEMYEPFIQELNRSGLVLLNHYDCQLSQSIFNGDKPQTGDAEKKPEIIEGLKKRFNMTAEEVFSQKIRVNEEGEVVDDSKEKPEKFKLKKEIPIGRGGRKVKN